MPTKTEQSDLFQAAFSAHGDVRAAGAGADDRRRHLRDHRRGVQHRRAVPDAGHRALRPGDRAAQGDRRPDRHRALHASSNGARPTGAELEHYARFRLTESGISPISHPGMPGGNYLGAGIEHNEHGAPTASGAIHARMNEKRIRKLDAAASARATCSTSRATRTRRSRSSAGAAIAGVCREALALRAGRGPRASSCSCPSCSTRSPRRSTASSSPRVRAGLVVEQSHQGQLYRLLRMFVDVPARRRSRSPQRRQPVPARRGRRRACASWRSRCSAACRRRSQPRSDVRRP